MERSGAAWRGAGCGGGEVDEVSGSHGIEDYGAGRTSAGAGCWCGSAVERIEWGQRPCQYAGGTACEPIYNAAGCTTRKPANSTALFGLWLREWQPIDTGGERACTAQRQRKPIRSGRAVRTGNNAGRRRPARAGQAAGFRNGDFSQQRAITSLPGENRRQERQEKG